MALYRETEFSRRIIMALWTAPIVSETPVGLEVTSYSPAEL